MVWRLLSENPTKTGRYCVGHRGLIFSDAYYTAVEGDTRYPVGWSQLPHFAPTHWWDGDYEMKGNFPDRHKLSGPSPQKHYSEGHSDGKNAIKRELLSLIKKWKFIKAYKLIKDIR